MAKGATVANNTPVGSAGQPYSNIMKEIPEGRAKAIKRRMEKKKEKDSGKKN